jgi:hypothetical protein
MNGVVYRLLFLKKNGKYTATILMPELYFEVTT